MTYPVTFKGNYFRTKFIAAEDHESQVSWLEGSWSRCAVLERVLLAARAEHPLGTC